MAYLGIDAGASATKWALLSEGKIIHEGKELPMDAHIYRPESLARFNEVLQNILTSTSEHTIEGLVIGITGLGKRQEVEEHLRKIIDVQTLLLTDIELAYKANFPDRSGILIYAGTGSVAITATSQEELHRIGGWGYLLGDEGAGYWIGREAIRTTLLTLDQNTPVGAFEETILAAMSCSNWDEIKAFVYGNERHVVAQLSRTVAQLAESNNRVAIDILNSASQHLLELVRRAESLSENQLEIRFTGGISQIPQIKENLQNKLGSRFSNSIVDIASAAAFMASMR